MSESRERPLDTRPVKCIGGDRDGEILHVAKSCAVVAFAVPQRDGMFKEVTRPVHKTRTGQDEVFTHAIPTRWFDV